MTIHFEFVVKGVPRTAQSKSVGKWRSLVRAAAEAQWNRRSAPIQEPVSVRLVYFHVGLTDRDVDNLIKPILDSLKGLVYADDDLVHEVTSRKTQLVTGLRIENAPPLVVSNLGIGTDFVLVRICSSPDHGRIPL